MGKNDFTGAIYRPLVKQRLLVSSVVPLSLDWLGALRFGAQEEASGLEDWKRKGKPNMH